MASPPQPGPAEPAAEDHLWDYLAVVLRHRKFALAIFLTATSVATIRTMLTRPVYLATAQILIERENVERPQLQGRHRGRRAPGTTTTRRSTGCCRAARWPARRREPEPAAGSRVRRPAQRPSRCRPPWPRRPASRPLIERRDRRSARPPAHQRRQGHAASWASAFEAFRPDLAMNIANKLSQLYIEQTLEFRYQTSSEAGEWLGGQVDQQRKKVEQATQELQKLKEREGIVNIEERRTLLAQKLNQLGTALTDAQDDAPGEGSALPPDARRATTPRTCPEVMKDPVVQSAAHGARRPRAASRRSCSRSTSTSTPRSSRSAGRSRRRGSGSRPRRSA